MADFFEELGKKISDVASDIGKMTEDTIEIQKLKSNIRGLQRANERDFIDIGRMVYEKFKDSEISDLDYVAMCEAIEKRDKEMERLEDESYVIASEPHQLVFVQGLNVLPCDHYASLRGLLKACQHIQQGRLA